MKIAPLFKSISEILSVMIALAGCVVLAGWALDIPLLKSILPGFVSMKANTAVSFVFLGLSLWFSQEKRSGSLLFRVAALVSALIVLHVGLLTFLEYIYGWDFGIDQFLFKEPAADVFTSSPGRMALNTSILFILSGAALLMAHLKAAFVAYLSQSAALIVGFIALLSLVGYLYGISPLYAGLNFSTAMALHTVVLFLIACAAYLFARPERGFVRHIAADEYGGKLLRRAVPVVILLSIIFGGILLVYHRSARSFDSFELGVLSMVFANLFVLVATAYTLSAYLNKLDRKRAEAEKGVKASNTLLRDIIDTSPDFIFLKDADLRTVLCNNQYAKAAGKTPEEMVGHTDIENGWDPVLVRGAPERGITGFENDDRKVLAGETVHSSYDPANAGGEVLIFDTYKMPLRDAGGTVFGVLGIARDITGLVKIQAELKEKIEFLERSAKIMVDRELKMVELKEKLAALEKKLKERGGRKTPGHMT